MGPLFYFIAHLQQERGHVELAQLGGEVERRLPAEVAGVHLSPVQDQRLDNLEPERRETKTQPLVSTYVEHAA